MSTQAAPAPRASRARLAFEVLASAALVLAVAWSLLAHPWSGEIFCLRTATGEDADRLRTLTGAWDLAFGLAYSWIPISLVLVWVALKIRPAGPLLVLYGLFVALCGGGHVMKWWNLFHGPNYWAAMKLSACGGAVSLVVGYVTHRKRRQLVGLGDTGDLLRRKTAAAEEAEHDARVERERAEKEAESARIANAALVERAAELAEANARLEEQARQLEEQARAGEEREQELQRALDRTRAQDKAIAELSTPTIELDDGMLLLPIVGVFDSARALQIVEQASATVTARGIEVVIVDVTGVPVMDSGVVDAFVRLARVLALLGARCVLTGIRGAVAQTMVEQGVAIEGFVTRATLKAGIREARAIAAAARR